MLFLLKKQLELLEKELKRLEDSIYLQLTVFKNYNMLTKLRGRKRKIEEKIIYYTNLLEPEDGKK